MRPQPSSATRWIPAVSSKDFQGLGRYVIAAFPLFLTLALLLVLFALARRPCDRSRRRRLRSVSTRA